MQGCDTLQTAEWNPFNPPPPSNGCEWARAIYVDEATISGLREIQKDNSHILKYPSWPLLAEELSKEDLARLNLIIKPHKDTLDTRKGISDHNRVYEQVCSQIIK